MSDEKEDGSLEIDTSTCVVVRILKFLSFQYNEYWAFDSLRTFVVVKHVIPSPLNYLGNARLCFVFQECSQIWDGH